MSKQSRDIGKRGEMRAAHLLSSWGGWGHVVRTAESMTGTRLGDDLCRKLGPQSYEPLPVSVEVKAGEQAFTTDWIEQAKRQAGDRPWLLVWVAKGCRRGREWMVTPHPEHPDLWRMEWSSVWAERMTREQA